MNKLFNAIIEYSSRNILSRLFIIISLTYLYGDFYGDNVFSLMDTMDLFYIAIDAFIVLWCLIIQNIIYMKINKSEFNNK